MKRDSFGGPQECGYGHIAYTAYLYSLLDEGGDGHFFMGLSDPEVRAWIAAGKVMYDLATGKAPEWANVMANKIGWEPPQ